MAKIAGASRAVIQKIREVEAKTRCFFCGRRPSRGLFRCWHPPCSGYAFCRLTAREKRSREGGCHAKTLKQKLLGFQERLENVVASESKLTFP